MLEIEKKEYIDYLYDEDLLEPLIENLKRYTGQGSDGLLSSDHLEQLAVSLEKYEAFDDANS